MRLASAFRHTQTVVAILRADDACFVDLNPAGERLLGYSRVEVLGRTPVELELWPDVLERAELWRRIGADGSAHAAPLQLRSRDGRLIAAQLDCEAFEHDGVALLLCLLREVAAVPATAAAGVDETAAAQLAENLQRAVAKLRFLATHDSLTGLCNHLEFQQRLDERLRLAHLRNEHDYALLYLDLDGFKLVNDSMGHAAGDLMLVTLAAKLSDAFNDEALIARYGGDEFTLLPIGPCDRARAEAMAARVLELFFGSIDIGEQHAYSSASLGLVLGRPEYREAAQLLRDAEIAMYRAKAQGKSAYVVFDDAMHRATRDRFNLENDLRHALERAEFEVFYQPLVLLPERRIVGCEALIRWRHPRRGLLLPEDFLDAAEEIGVLERLDNWVLRTACVEFGRWTREYCAEQPFKLCVNVDDAQVAGPDLARRVADALALGGLPASSLRLEITETIFRIGRQHVLDVLRQLKQLGTGLVVDDFGTGWSSLNSFVVAPFDALKIDRSFVADIETNTRHRAIVRTIIGFASDLGLALTAEGVENANQESLLLSLGCDLVQGFRYSRAVPAAQFERLLQSEAAR